MGTPLWYPIPQYRRKIAQDGLKQTIRGLCAVNSIPCKFSGAGADRVVFLQRSRQPFIHCLPHQQGVCIGSRYPAKSRLASRYALAAMAYALFDLAARESVKGLAEFSKISVSGRPRVGRVKSNAERQRAYRLRNSNSLSKK